MTTSVSRRMGASYLPRRPHKLCHASYAYHCSLRNFAQCLCREWPQLVVKIVC